MFLDAGYLQLDELKHMFEALPDLLFKVSGSGKDEEGKNRENCFPGPKQPF